MMDELIKQYETLAMIKEVQYTLAKNKIGVDAYGWLLEQGYTADDIFKFSCALVFFKVGE